MDTYIAKDGERIDALVYRHYKSLKPLVRVLELNYKLPVTLKAGDKVILPALAIPQKPPRLW